MIHLLISLAVVLLILSFFLALARVLRGPSLPDRLIALEVISSLSLLAILGVYVFNPQSWLLDTALVWTFLPFLALLFVVQLLKKGSRYE